MPEAVATKNFYDRNTNSKVHGLWIKKRAPLVKLGLKYASGALDADLNILGCYDCDKGFKLPIHLANHMASHAREAMRLAPRMPQRSSSRHVQLAGCSAQLAGSAQSTGCVDGHEGGSRESGKKRSTAEGGMQSQTEVGGSQKQLRGRIVESLTAAQRQAAARNRKLDRLAWVAAREAKLAECARAEEMIEESADMLEDPPGGYFVRDPTDENITPQQRNAAAEELGYASMRLDAEQLACLKYITGLNGWLAKLTEATANGGTARGRKTLGSVQKGITAWLKEHGRK